MAGSGLAFRAQLVIPEQRQLYDYWSERADGRPMPTRDDLSPRDIPRLLPCVSLIDIEQDTSRYRVRLAGTRLYDAYCGEITGKYVDELDWGANREYWLSSYRRVVQAALPAQGIVRAPREETEHLVQFWLRLPLAGECGDVSMILSYDAFVPVSEAISLAGELSSLERPAAQLAG